MRRARPPSRVNHACDRCRRQKQRCDFVRPCQNCLHARTECTRFDDAASNKRPRLSEPPQSQEASTPARRGLTHPEPSLDASGIGGHQTFHEASSIPPDGHSAFREASSIPPDGHPTFHEATSIPPGGHPTFHEATSIPPTGHPAFRETSSIPPGEPPGRLYGVQREGVSGERHEIQHETSVLRELRGSDSAMGITKKFLAYAGSPPVGARETFAIPGGDSNRTLDQTPAFSRPMPISEVLETNLPSRQVSDALVDTYFHTVHWFSLVVYEPKFRARYTTIMDRGLAVPSDRSFLLLLLMVMVMGCWYGPGVLPPEIASTVDLDNTRKAFLKVVSQNFMDLIDEDCLDFVQLSTLLGSYWLYWGRPRSAFSLLGAATKSAQAMELHRDMDHRLSPQDTEERKRVWWTIYTWDRFATIIYGRPLGINDKDCNVSMPASFSENISFSSTSGPERVSLSPYQIQLNRIYQIASPLLENIYGIRYSHDRSLRSQMPSTVKKIDQLMQAWQDDLPPHLHLDKNDDVSLTSSTEEKMHRLQALSLQLTYDNLMIVIHRPLLADQGYRRSRTQNAYRPPSPHPNGNSSPDEESKGTNDINLRQCLASALRISKVQQNKRHLLALARSTHLVSFLGMNLFTSSVVMFICALSDTLSDIAQEAKRGMARNLKMLKLLSGDGSLSMQCSVILEDLVQQIVNKEKEEMLRALPTDDEIAAFLPTRRNSYVDDHAGLNGIETGLEASTHANNMLKQSTELLNGEASGNDGFAVHRAMASLQGVFKDAAAPRPAPTSMGHSTDRSHQQHFEHSQMQQVGQGGTTEFAGFTFDGSIFNTEDLGQFWLWNMEPYLDDSSAGWQSGDDRIQ